MQSVSVRIWTRVAVSISYGDNHYTTGTSFFINIHSIIWFDFFVSCHINLCGLSNAEAIFIEEQ